MTTITRYEHKDDVLEIKDTQLFLNGSVYGDFQADTKIEVKEDGIYVDDQCVTSAKRTKMCTDEEQECTESKVPETAASTSDAAEQEQMNEPEGGKAETSSTATTVEVPASQGAGTSSQESEEKNAPLATQVMEMPMTQEVE
jgi:hypothetical protein